MTTHLSIAALVGHGRKAGLLAPGDETWAIGRLLEVLGLDGFDPPDHLPDLPLETILTQLVDDAVRRGRCGESIAQRDLFDTRLMGAITPPPSAVTGQFAALYRQSPQSATDWFYQFCQDADYIRAYRIARDRRWTVETEYGPLDITINLSKPEKDPKDIAAAKAAPPSGYPKCALCRENEGYAGRADWPARQTLRLIPLTLGGQPWYFQYSPYVYYNEHCIVLSREHRPMAIDQDTFSLLLDFVSQFPHYMVGSNADLPIVGGSILSHQHFQGGRYSFPMERAAVETPVHFSAFPDVEAGVLRWPMTVLRLAGGDPGRLTQLAGRVLAAWRGHSDPALGLLAETEGVPHHTLTPIARRRAGRYELDLVLRSNRTTAEHPLGLFHPHQELHHIKKENIGLIEVMGLAVLPARLQGELAGLEEAIATGRDISGDPALAKHQPWLEELKGRHTFTPENTAAILRQEVGQVFAQVLSHCAVYPRTPHGQAALLAFLETI